MPLHLKKLCVGVASIDDLLASIEQRRQMQHEATGAPFIWITTRSKPKRTQEIIGQGGSLYWIINGLMCARQEILCFRPSTRADGKPCVRIELDHSLHLVTPRRHHAFQGWRYLEAQAAPADLTAAHPGAGAQEDDVLPAAMTQELAELGLL